MCHSCSGLLARVRVESLARYRVSRQNMYADVGCYTEIYRILRRNISDSTPIYVKYAIYIRNADTPQTERIWGRFWEMPYIQSNTNTVRGTYGNVFNNPMLCCVWSSCCAAFHHLIIHVVLYHFDSWRKPVVHKYFFRSRIADQQCACCLTNK